MPDHGPTSDGEPANAHIVRHSKKLRILKLVQSEALPTPSPTFCPLQVPLWRGQFTLKQDFGWGTIWFGHTGGGFINEVLLAAAQSVGRGNLWDNRAPGLLYDCPRDMSSSLQIIAR